MRDRALIATLVSAMLVGGTGVVSVLIANTDHGVGPPLVRAVEQPFACVDPHASFEVSRLRGHSDAVVLLERIGLGGVVAVIPLPDKRGQRVTLTDPSVTYPGQGHSYNVTVQVQGVDFAVARFIVFNTCS